MAEERVVLSAELRDEASAPLGALSRETVKANKQIAKSATDQADAVAAAAKKISGSAGGVGKDMDAMSSAAKRASGKTSAAVDEAASQISRASGRIGAAAKKAGEESGTQMASGFSSKVKGMVAGAVAAVGIGKIAGFAKESVNQFSELEDSSAAAGVVFGKNMGDIQKIADTAGEKLGLTQQQVINAANSYGTYGKAAGLGGKDLSKFAGGLTGLAADMASFKGTSPEQALEAIGAGLRGETEPLRAYGIMLDDASMRNQAMKMGLVKTTKEALSPQNKILAANALIWQQSKDAQGDFARTSNSTANVAKRLESAQTNLAAKIGGKLAPAFTAVRLKALGVVNGISSLVDKVSAAQAVWKTGTNADVAKALGLSPEAAARFSAVVGPVRAFFGAFRDGSSDVTSSGLAGTFERIGGVLGRVVGGLQMTGEESRKIGFQMDPLVKRVYVLKETFLELLRNLSPGQWAGIAGGAGLLLASFGKLSPILSPVLGMFSKLGPMVGGLGGALKFLMGPIGLISGLLLAAYMTNEPFRNSINALVGTLMTLAGQLLSQLMPVFSTLMTTLLPVISSLFASLIPIVIQIVGAVAPLIAQLAAQLLPLFVQLITAVLPPIMGLLTTLAPIFAQLVAAVAPLIPPVMEIVALLIQMAMQVLTPLIPIIGVVAGILSKVLGGAISFLMPIIKFLVEAFVNVVNYLKGPVSEAVKFVGGLFEGIAKVIGDVAKNVGDFVSNPLGGIQDMLGIPKNSGGGVYASGGAVALAGGGVLGGYAPGKDTIPAMLSKGESVLVPELTRAIGPSNIMALNREYSGGRKPGAGPAAAALSSVTASDSGGNTYHVSVVVQGDGDPEEIKRAVREALAEAAAEERRRSYA
ncbi:tape measure protein [Arthrobacter phage Altadena]|uniref:Tape measure protein n=1 Tax=Arthrobacter phage Altadena TaxID=3059064 RepID=A0AA96HTB3_9CAUD|nr:tape measure protein [Arthrobacter phage Altadena]